MTSSPVKELLNEASVYLKQAEQLGSGDSRVADLAMACEGTLDSINIYVMGSDEDAWGKISTKNKELNEMFHKEFEKRLGEKDDKGPYFQLHRAKKIDRELKLWKCEQKYSFYDWLTKKYDI